MASMEECGKSIKAMIAGMSSTEVLHIFGPCLLEGEAFKGLREALQRALQRASTEQAPQRLSDSAPQPELRSGEQSVDSDQSSCASSYNGR